MKKLKISFEEESKQEKNKRKYKKYPRIDVNAIMFGSEEDIENENVKYIKKIKGKVIKRYFIPSVIIAVLAIVTISCFFTHIYKENISEKETVIASQKEQIYELETYKKTVIASQKEQIDELETYKKNNPKEAAERYLQKRKASNNQNTSNAATDERKCTVPDCNNRANTGSYYCSRHECLKIGCHEPKANDLCLYCEKHKCDMPGCNSAKALNSYYCYIHP